MHYTVYTCSYLQFLKNLNNLCQNDVSVYLVQCVCIIAKGIQIVLLFFLSKCFSRYTTKLSDKAPNYRLIVAQD